MDSCGKGKEFLISMKDENFWTSLAIVISHIKLSFIESYVTSQYLYEVLWHLL